MTHRHGGCLCGAVRYEIKGAPVMTVLCHCSHCKRQSGAMFSTNVAVAEADYAQHGETKVYHDTGDTGQPVDRYFCGNCGSPILTRAAAFAGLALVKAGTLDDVSWLDPKVEVYADRAVGWVAPIADAQRFGEGLM